MSATPAPPSALSPAHRLARSLLIAVAALALSLCIFSPRLWVFRAPMPGSTYWDRGLHFVQQCNAPLGAPVEDAGLIWRLAPVILAKLLGLHGYAVLIVPWLGLLVLLAQCAWIIQARTGDWRLSTWATGLVATTGAILTGTGWLGMNDAWYAAALLAVALQPGWPALTLAALAGPWIDERFALAVPLALAVRALAPGRSGRVRGAFILVATGLLLYVGGRLLNPFHVQTSGFGSYAHDMRAGAFLQWTPWTDLGWFMGLRAAWVLVALAIGREWWEGRRLAACWLAGLALAPLVIINFLASDTSRAPTMLLPLLLLGLEQAVAQWGAAASRRLLAGLLIANLLMPAMHVSAKHGDIINLLPLELVRLLRP